LIVCLNVFPKEKGERNVRMVRSKKVRLLLVLVAVVAAVGLVAAAGGQKKRGDTSAETAEPKLVETITVTPGKAGRHSEFSGVLQAGEESMVSFEVAGRILEMRVSEGDEVKEGEVLARVDAAEYNLQMTQAKAGLDKAQVNYWQAKEDYARMEQLHAAGAISQLDFENAKNRLSVAEADLFQAQQSLALLQDKALLKSPVSGTILNKLSAVGQLVSPGVPVYRIGRLDPLKVVLPVPDKDVAAWRAGDEVILSLYGRTRKGKVARVFPSTNQGTGTVGVEVSVPNTEQDWLPGQVVNATRAAAMKKGLFVPVGAVINRGEEKPYVFLAAAGKAVKTPVTIGELYGDRLEILSGLKPGDQVIVKGADLLFDGDPIEQPGGTGK